MQSRHKNLFDLAKEKNASDHRSNLDKIYAVQKDDQTILLKVV